MPPPWEIALPWLVVKLHHTTETNVADLQAYFGSHPETAQLPNDRGYLPLHVAASCQCGEYAASVIDILCRMYPPGAKRKSELWPNCLPLHCAALFQSGEHGDAVVAALLAACPEAAQEMDDDGRLPLHLAAMWQCEEGAAALVTALLTVYPHASQQQDNTGMLPLHLAFQRWEEEPSVAVVQALLTAYPQAVRHDDTNGRLPADYAESHPSVPALCMTLLRDAEEGCSPPEDGATAAISRHSSSSLPVCGTAVEDDDLAAASTSPPQGVSSLHTTHESRGERATDDAGNHNAETAADTLLMVADPQANKAKLDQEPDDVSGFRGGSDDDAVTSSNPAVVRTASGSHVLAPRRLSLRGSGASTTAGSAASQPSAASHTQAHSADVSSDSDSDSSSDDVPHLASAAQPSRQSTLRGVASQASGSDREKPFGCSECDCAFVRQSHLTLHMRSHTGEKAVVAGKSALYRHKRTHAGNIRYDCDECHRAFSKKSHLTAHIRTHTGEKPYTCTECSRAFARKDGLADHMRTHTGEKPYTCTRCKRAFAHKSTLTNHMRRHTDERS